MFIVKVLLILPAKMKRIPYILLLLCALSFSGMRTSAETPKRESPTATDTPTLTVAQASFTVKGSPDCPLTFEVYSLTGQLVKRFKLKDGSFTLQYKSAIAFGKAEIVTEDAEKIHGLRLICEHFLPQHMDAFDQSIARSLSRTAVVRVTLTEPPTGKRKQYDKEGVEMKYGRIE